MNTGAAWSRPDKAKGLTEAQAEQEAAQLPALRTAKGSALAQKQGLLTSLRTET